MKKAQLLILVTLAMISMACTISGVSVDVNHTEGSGVLIKEERAVEDFNNITISGIGNLFIVQGDENKVVIEAEDNILSKLTTTVTGDKLTIGVERGFNIVPTQEINYYVTMKEVTGIHVMGAGKVTADSIVTDRLGMKLTGFGSMEITDLEADNLSIIISGAGDVNLSGVTTHQDIEISGAGNYHAEDLQSQTAVVTVSGFGNSDLWVEESLSVVISGGGNINYYGNPQTSRTITGLGKLTSQGDHY